MDRHRIVRYVLVGGLAYLVEIGSLYLLRYHLGLSPVYAVAVSFWIGFTVAFGLQKVVTFQEHSPYLRVVAGQLLKYSLLVAFNYVFTLIAVKLLSKDISVLIIRTLVIGLVTLWNYPVYQKIFRKTTYGTQSNQEN